jgi:putative polyhydroxyalkanoate system protein
MPKLTIEQSHDLDPPTVRTRLDALSTRLADKYGIHAVWTSDTEAKFDRTGATGFIRVQPNRVLIQVDLSFALSPVKSKVESRIREELRRALAGTPGDDEPA